jgi:dephospho-CoA kinase
MKLVALAGGIGCGKSTVSGLLADRGAVVVDVDVLSRELQQPGQPVFIAMVDRWGSRIVGADGSLERQTVADVVFTNREEMAALMAMTSPAIEEGLYQRISQHHGTDRVVLLEAALLSGPRRLYGTTAVMIVDAPEDVAVARLVNGRGMDEADVRARMAHQPARADRLARADHVVDNSGDLDALREQIDAAWTWLHTQPDSEVERRVEA